MRARSLPVVAVIAIASLAVASGLPRPARAQATAAGTASTQWVAAPAQVTLRPQGDLLARIGAGAATRLMRSNDPDERLRGLEQAAGRHGHEDNPESLALLERAAGTDASKGLDPHMPPEGIARTDPRAVLAVV